MKTILVTGGAGYKGCVLVPKLLRAGYAVIVYDLMLFGSQGLPSHPHLKVVRGDIRDSAKYSRAVAGADCVIHMACISNDPSFDLDPSLSRTINYECFEPLVVASKAAGVKRFLYVSTSSVYGVSDAPEVTEDHPFVPLTDYNKYKGLCEPILLRHQSPGFVTTIIRPATVCGYSPRMRFDLTVNILTNHAVRKGVITVFGGAQKRPNIHIEDITDLYVQLLDTAGGTHRGRSVQCRVRESHGRATGRAGAASRGGGVSRKGAHPRRDNRLERPPLLSRFVAKNRGEAGMEAKAHDRRCRSRLVPRVQRRQIPRQHDERQLRERPRRQTTRPQMMAPYRETATAAILRPV